MRLLPLILLSLLFVANSAGALADTDAQSTWTIDPKESKITFIAFRSGRIPATGRFSNLSGKIIYDGKNLKTAKVVASIPLGSIKTGMDKRDSDLKGAYYFDFKKFVNATFSSLGVRDTDEKRYVLMGALDLHGVKKSVDLALDPPVITVVKGKEHLQARAATVLAPAEYLLDLTKLHPEGKVKVDLVEIQLSISADKGSAK